MMPEEMRCFSLNRRLENGVNSNSEGNALVPQLCSAQNPKFQTD